MSTVMEHAAVKNIRYRIDAMDCPTEEALIRGKLGSMPGIKGLEFNLIKRVLTVNHTLDSLNPIESAIKSLGFEPVLHDLDTSTQVPRRLNIKQWLPLVIAGLSAIGAEVTEVLGLLSPWLPAGLAIVAVILGGWSTYKKGWIAIVNRNLNINALMSIAVTGALFLRQWPEAAMVMVLFTLAEKIEALSLDRARNAIKGLMDLSPDQATIQLADGSWSVLEAKSVAVGTIVRVRPGERFSHDGVVSHGQSAVDQSPITGESMPIDKGPGDSVFAGTINQQGELLYVVSSEAKASTLSRIIHLVEEAQASRSTAQRFVDRFAKVYTPVVFGLAVLVAIIPPLFLGAAWTDWVYKALVMLVIACPCALVISTPVTIVSALTQAARLGIVIKGGIYLESARRIKWLAFDKTGTITRGKPTQTDFISLHDTSLDLAQFAASLAHRSDHPVSRAIAERAKETGVTVVDIAQFTALAGRGVSGVIQDQVWYLGNHRLIEELGICNLTLEAQLTTLEEAGKTAVVLASSTKPWAVFGVTDTIKPTSREAIRELHKSGIKTLMLSGDNQKTASAIGRQVGIDEVRGDQLPEDKALVIKNLVSSGNIVAMTGDGINDAPALAQANIGVAMGGSGTDTAIETADVVLMDDDLRKIPQLVRLSRDTVAVLVQNISFALGIKVVFLVLTALGYGTMWMAVFADMGASLIVVFNGLRLMKGGRELSSVITETPEHGQSACCKHGQCG